MGTYKMDRINPKYREAVKNALASAYPKWVNLTEITDYHILFLGELAFAEDLFIGGDEK